MTNKNKNHIKFNKKKIDFILCFLCFCVLFLLENIYLKNNNISAANYSWGSTGDIVKNIQKKVKRWGYFDGNVDGIFGAQTYNAVIDFQKKNNLKADGIVGEETLNALDIFDNNNQKDFDIDFASNRENNIWLLASLINAEARGEEYIGQVAVGAVVLNRVKNSSFPNTIPAVIYEVNQFESISDGQINLTPSESCLNAARDAMNGWDPTGGAIYYWNPQKTKNQWILNLPITMIIGNHAFASGA